MLLLWPGITNWVWYFESDPAASAGNKSGKWICVRCDGGENLLAETLSPVSLTHLLCAAAGKAGQEQARFVCLI